MKVNINTKNVTYPIKSNYIEHNNQIIKILKEPPPFDFDNFYDKNAKHILGRVTKSNEE